MLWIHVSPFYLLTEVWARSPGWRWTGEVLRRRGQQMAWWAGQGKIWWALSAQLGSWDFILIVKLSSLRGGGEDVIIQKVKWFKNCMTKPQFLLEKNQTQNKGPEGRARSSRWWVPSRRRSWPHLYFRKTPLWNDATSRICIQITLDQGFTGSANGKEPACQCRRHKRHRFNPWVGKILWIGNGNPLQYSCLENPMDREAWWAAVQRVTNSWIRLKQLSRQATLDQKTKSN